MAGTHNKNVMFESIDIFLVEKNHNITIFNTDST